MGRGGRGQQGFSKSSFGGRRKAPVPRVSQTRTEQTSSGSGFVPAALNKNLVSFDQGTKALEALLNDQGIFGSKENRKNLRVSQAIQQVHSELAALSEEEFGGEFRSCFQIGDWIYKIPNQDKNDPIGTIGAQFTEAAAIDTEFEDDFAGLSVAEGFMFFHKTGIPIIAMERVDTSPEAFKEPDWLVKSRRGNSEVKLDLIAQTGYDSEIHQQVGYSKRSDSLVFFDVGCIPDDRPGREAEFEKSDYFWPGKTKAVIESRRKAIS